MKLRAAGLLLCFGIWLPGAAAGEEKELLSPKPTAAIAVASRETWRAQGETRYRAQCSRCHQAPHALSPRMMGTAIRHMRVRANISEMDMRLILYYMTQ